MFPVGDDNSQRRTTPVVTFVLIYLFRQAGWSDLTINVVSLTGLMLAIGMLVDNSIVVGAAG